MSKRISLKSYAYCLLAVKYYPVLMQLIIFMNFFDHYYPGSFTNFLYPIIGHSVAYDILLLVLSRMFAFCAWHRLLIYSMLYNIFIEWITVNFNIPIKYDSIMDISVLVSAGFLVASLVLRFKIGCDHERDID